MFDARSLAQFGCRLPFLGKLLSQFGYGFDVGRKRGKGKLVSHLTIIEGYLTRCRVGFGDLVIAKATIHAKRIHDAKHYKVDGIIGSGYIPGTVYGLSYVAGSTQPPAFIAGITSKDCIGNGYLQAKSIILYNSNQPQNDLVFKVAEVSGYGCRNGKYYISGIIISTPLIDGEILSIPYVIGQIPTVQNIAGQSISESYIPGKTASEISILTNIEAP